MIRPEPVKIQCVPMLSRQMGQDDRPVAVQKGTSLLTRMGSLVILGFLTFGMASPALAQDASMTRQVEQLRKDLDLLQRYVYREGPPANGAGASSGAGAANSDTPAAARQQIQIDNLQSQITQLTGQIEEQGYKVRQMSDRLDRLISDVDFRLSQLEGKTGASFGGASDGMAPAGNEGAAAGAASGAAAGAAAGAGAASGGSANAGATGNLGGAGSGQQLDKNGTRLFGVIRNEGKAPDIPSGPQGGNNTAAGAAGAAAGAAASTDGGNGVLPAGSPQEQYRYAFGLLRQQKFPEAETALRAFVKAHPDDSLAGNAQYWLGETFYVRGNYDQAALAFTEGFQKYPDSPKAADNLLKLGMSLANLGKTDDACLTYDHLLTNFKSASSVILDRARQEKKNRKCK